MKRTIAIAALLMIAAGCAKAQHPYAKGNNLSVIFFDVGQGDSAMIIAPDGRRVLIDCGEFNDTAFYLKTMNITFIDVMIITHPDKDHEGGCDDVLEVADVGKVLTNSNVYGDFAIGLSQSAFIEAIVAYDSNGMFKGDNDNSVMLKVGYGNTSFLFTGDCEERCEEELVKTHELDVDILKLGHHGSKHSSTPEFLAKTSPSIAVVSSGKGNQYGHPHNETLERLGNAGIAVYRTDTLGTIIITTDGSGYSVI